MEVCRCIPPSFALAWTRFAEVHVAVAAVGTKIGGKVGANVASGVFQNACPIPMSYVLNHTGVPIPKAGYHVSSGADQKWYMYRVPEMMLFLQRTFGKPDAVHSRPSPKDFMGQKGILAIRGTGWNNAVGHVTLWNGATCSDTCHLMGDPENGTFAPDSASLWRLA